MAQDRRSRQAGRLPPLHLLRAFEAVGRTDSMRKAADMAGVSHTVISRHVRDLEHWLGTKLVVAGPRGVTLTEQGRLLHASVSKAFRIMASAASELLASRSGSLEIWCVPGLATRWLAPRLGDIEDALRGVEILIRPIDPALAMPVGDADVVIGFADVSATPPGAELLVRPRMFPVASPAWIARHGAPSTLEELAEASLIHEESRRQWTEWFYAAGAPLAPVLRGPRLWDAKLGFDAALSGQGVALASRLLAGAELERGALVELLRTDVRLGAYFMLVKPERGEGSAALRFRNWMLAEIDRCDPAEE